AAEEPRLVRATPAGEVFLEPVVPRPLLVVVGAGHVGQAVAWQAETVGFDVVVVDDRQELLQADRFPRGTATRCGPMAAVVDSLPLTHRSFVVIVTRGHQHDGEVLAACLQKPSAYIGMIGSRRKVAQMRRDFLQSGLATAEAFDRVYAPIGLDIGATTVPEIATSIVAQLIALRRRGSAPRIVAPCHEPQRP
ncbi:MAG: XdhC family protein, partial [Thermoguttaceae bacterium]